jgi:hypothetical protein
MAMTRRGFAFLAVVLTVIPGCSTGTPPRNSVTGKVTLNGQPVSEGLVTFHGQNGQSANGSICPDGSYTIDDPPLGLCQITVQGAPGLAYGARDPAEHGTPAESERRPSLVPAKYSQLGNGLRMDVTPGRHVRDLPLTS